MLRKRYGVEGVPSDEQLAVITQGERLIVVPWRFESDLKELYCDGYLAIRSDLPRPWHRWLTAHGLMHHLIHVGNQLDGPCLAVAKQERMADIAAGYLLWYEHAVNGHRQPLMPWQLAEIAEVPVECVRRWHSLISEMMEDAMMSPLAASQRPAGRFGI